MENEITSLYPHFKDLDVKINKTYKTINFKGQDIKIAEYLPVDEKIALIDIALQKSMYNGMVHPLRLKKYYELGLVYMYSDIIFTEEDKADEAKIYDELYTSGLLNEIIKNINGKEIILLKEMLNDTKNAYSKYISSAAGMVDILLESLSTRIPALQESLSNLSPETLMQLGEIAGLN